MSTLVMSVKDKVQRRFPDLTDTIALEYINAVHADILRQLPLVTATEDLTLVAGTQEYALNEETIRVVAAEYLTSGTNRRALEPTDYDYLNQEQRGWRGLSAGTPSHFYMWRSAGDNVVGLLPKPSTGTSGGYPIVRLHVTRVETLTGGDSLPKGLLTYDAYVYGTQMRFAMDHREYAGEVAGLRALYDEAMARERKAFEERHPYRRRIAMSGINLGGVS